MFVQLIEQTYTFKVILIDISLNRYLNGKYLY
jgi:hypothetical protein